jgi:glycosyltransferase involved in cell wall biosynthesis
MRILWYNWRDIKNPDAGGAEVFTHEVCKRLVTQKNKMNNNTWSITLFAAAFPNGKEEELIDGIRIVRRGNKYNVYDKAKEFFRKNKDDYDIIIDEINTKPFMTPTFVRDKPIVALVHQLAREFWFYETPFPISLLGYLLLEKRWLKKYVKIPTVTVSESSKQDLLEWGFKNVLIVSEGIGFKPLDKLPDKESVPTVIFVGRLKKAKKPDDAIRAFKIIRDEIPEARMWIVGDGYMMNKLKKIAYSSTRKVNYYDSKRQQHSLVDNSLTGATINPAQVHANSSSSAEVTTTIALEKTNVDNSSNPNITFFGKVSISKKLELMSRAHLLLVPGVREGWGLVVTEANARGTPAIGYEVHGLRDSILDGLTGKLVARGDPVAMAIEAIELLTHKEMLKKYSTNALNNSRNFDWDKTAHQVAEILSKSAATYYGRDT